jgi:hypothetical protein
MVPGVGVELFRALILRNLLNLQERRQRKKRQISQCGHVVGTPEWGIKMREEIRKELQREIAEKFEQARGPKLPVKQISEEERQARTARYADLLIESALRQVSGDHH